MSRILFTEKQKFRHTWLWLAFLPVFIVFNGLMFYMVEKHSNTGIIISAISVLPATASTMLLFFCMQLNTIIKEDGIYVKYFPFHFKYKKYAWEQIDKLYLRKYGLGEFGGYGIRFGKHGKAYNVSGNMGLQLELTTGKKLLIGTGKAEEMAEVLKAVNSEKIRFIC